jgi:hypothetical protein
MRGREWATRSGREPRARDSRAALVLPCAATGLPATGRARARACSSDEPPSPAAGYAELPAGESIPTVTVFAALAYADHLRVQPGGTKLRS